MKYTCCSTCYGWESELLSLRSWALWSRFSLRMSLYFPPFTLSSNLTSLPVPGAWKHLHSMMLPAPIFTIGRMPGFLQTWRLEFRPKSSILVSSDQKILFLMAWEYFQGKLQVGCHVPFTGSGFCLATLPYRPDWWSSAEMVVLLECSPISTEELWSSVRVTIGF